MDRKPSESPEILRLVHLAEQSRALLGEEASRLRQKLDLPSRMRDSLRNHPSSWLFGSLATGLAASFAFRRRPAATVKKRRGIPATLLGLTLTAARPIAKVWLAGQAKRWLAASSVSSGRNIP